MKKMESEMNIEQIAELCHEANATYCRLYGDESQMPWNLAPEWQRQSAVNGVKFHIENPGAGPEASHENWLAEKAALGWGYGPVKDAEKKQHPCFMPYDGLPIEQRMKDSLFIAVVNCFRHRVTI